MPRALIFAAFMLARAAAASTSAADSTAVTITVGDWTSGIATNSTPTYQTSINPKYRADKGNPSNISDTVYANMKALDADFMRHVPWFPYPHLAVAELNPVNKTAAGGGCTTSWNWTLIDPISEGVFGATGDHPMVLNFATTPEWFWQANVSFPADPNRRFAGYEQGTKLLDTSYKQIVDYYHRLAQWYTGVGGGFEDECGVFHKSPHAQKNIAWWEIFNEMEHRLPIGYYDELYDAIVSDLRVLLPDMKFLGLAMGSHDQFQSYTYHLNRSNHHPHDIPLDGISYHQYVSGSGQDLPTLGPQYFGAMDTFVEEVTKIEGIKKAMSPTTETFINEPVRILQSPLF